MFFLMSAIYDKKLLSFIPESLLCYLPMYVLHGFMPTIYKRPCKYMYMYVYKM